ncbi:MAG: lycopene cyclase family protein, partial [Pyrinomonadaceae bacterium]
MKRKTEILILGAGLSGTLLAAQLEREGYSGEITLLDARTDFSQEQRWCSWANPLPVLAPIIKKTWHRWKVVDWNFSTTQSSLTMPYRQIYAPDFYSHFHSRWKSQNRVSLVLGEKVLRVEEKSGIVKVLTDKTFWQAKLVFDARGNFYRLKNQVILYQTFLGFLAEFTHSVFDTETITLMDFRLKGSSKLASCINFVYILPYSETEALIESTSFS